MSAMSEWLEIMLAEIDRKRDESASARAEREASAAATSTRAAPVKARP